jgi:transcriptional regulator PpsR
MAQSGSAIHRSSGPHDCPPGCIPASVYDRLVAAGSDLALVLDGDGIIREISQGEGAGGQQRWKALLGRRWSETTAPDSRAKVDQLLQEARRGAVPRPREVNQQAEGGAEVPFRFSAVLLGDEERVVALGHDLRAVSTLQQQLVGAQQAMDREYERLRQAETRYRLLFQVSSEPVLVVEIATLKVIEANPAASALLKEPLQTLRGRTAQGLFESGSWPAGQAAFVSAEAGGRSPDVEVGLASPGGAMTLSASFFRQSGSGLLLLCLRPVGSEGAPRSSRGSRMLAVIDALPDGFVVIGEDRRILSANRAFCELVHQPNETQVVGQPLDRWLGRPGVDLNILLANLREHGVVRSFSTIVHGDFGAPQEAVVSAVSALEAKVPCLGFVIRTLTPRLAVVTSEGKSMPRSVEQLRGLVGSVSLKEIVRESTDLIERLCIEAALQVSGDNRASAAQLLGLSRQGLYSKLRRYGLGDLDPAEPE